MYTFVPKYAFDIKICSNIIIVTLVQLNGSRETLLTPNFWMVVYQLPILKLSSPFSSINQHLSIQHILKTTPVDQSALHI